MRALAGSVVRVAGFSNGARPAVREPFGVGHIRIADSFRAPGKCCGHVAVLHALSPAERIVRKPQMPIETVPADPLVHGLGEADIPGVDFSSISFSARTQPKAIPPSGTPEDFTRIRAEKYAAAWYAAARKGKQKLELTTATYGNQRIAKTQH